MLSHRQTKISKFEHLISVLNHTKPRVIGIDGESGAGKTKLAKKIALKIQAECIHLDDYIRPDLGTYEECIDEHLLKNSLNNYSSKCTLIFEGICLLRILSKLDIVPELLIYIPCIESDEYSDRLLYELSDVKSYKKETDERIKIWDPHGETPPLRLEVFSYIKEYKPHINSHIQYFQDING